MCCLQFEAIQVTSEWIKYLNIKKRDTNNKLNRIDNKKKLNLIKYFIAKDHNSMNQTNRKKGKNRATTEL